MVQCMEKREWIVRMYLCTHDWCTVGWLTVLYVQHTEVDRELPGLSVHHLSPCVTQPHHTTRNANTAQHCELTTTTNTISGRTPPHRLHHSYCPQAARNTCAFDRFWLRTSNLFAGHKAGHNPPRGAPHLCQTSDPSRTYSRDNRASYLRD